MRSRIYVGRVSHARGAPVKHAFWYRVFMVYLDLAELDEVFAGRWFWSTRRAAPARFDRADHIGDPCRPLDECVRDLVESRVGRRPCGPIRLLTNLRYFGYCFNPVSFYYCFDARDAAVETVVAEVTNTPWGERHCYVLDAAGASAERFVTDKVLHVSPFMPLDLRYEWCFTPPGRTLGVRMACERNGERLFTAALELEEKPIEGRVLARMLLTRPLQTQKVIAAIHWQALRLWWKRSPVYDHPARSS
jgi:DUF1365 family protein